MKETQTYTFYNSRDIPEDLQQIGVKSPGEWSVTKITTDSGIKTRIEQLSTLNEERQDINKTIENKIKELHEVGLSLIIKGNTGAAVTNRIRLGQDKTLEVLVDVQEEYRDNIFFIWESSVNSYEWESIIGENTPVITVSPKVTTSYRLKVTGIGLSGVVYSPVIRVFVEQVKKTKAVTE